MKKIILVILMAAFCLPVFGQWDHVSYTRGTDFTDVKFVDANTGYAVGDWGMILKTTDGGANWSEQSSGTTEYLYSVHFTDPNTGYAVGNSGIILKTINAGITWTSQISGTGQSLISVYFSDSNTGYAVGTSGVVLKTINAGINWTSQTSGTSAHLCSVYFSDSNTGYAVGSSGIILKTTNSGATWTSQTSGTSEYLYSVHFTDPNTGYAVGDYGTILKTTNGGTTWAPQVSGSTNMLRSIVFSDLNTGYAVGSGAIIKTTDAGTSWTSQSAGLSNSLSSISFAGTNTLYSVGGSGLILKTSDNGTNWIDLSICRILRSVYFTDANTGYSVGDHGQILKTIDAGSTWTKQNSGTQEQLCSVFFTDANLGYTVGNNGTILKTTNGGTTWISLTSGTSEKIESVYFTDVNTGYAVGSNATILKTVNGGLTWSTQHSGVIYSLKSVCFVNSTTGYAVGGELILKTTDGGVNWIQQSGGVSFYLNSVCFIDAITGYAVGYNGTILKTSDGGISWTKQISGITNTFNSVYFTDFNTGYAISSYNWGAILKTTDGGKTWKEDTQHNVVKSLNSIHFSGSKNGFIVGDGLTILKLNAPANEPPTISYVPSQTININTSFTGNFTIGDDITPVANLIVTATSANQTLVPNANLALSGTTGTRTLAINPATNQTGSALITVIVKDASNLADTTTVTLSVMAPANVVIPSIYKHTLPSNIPDTKITLAIEKNNQVWVFGSNGIVAKSSDLTMTSWTLCNTGIPGDLIINAADSYDGNTWVIGTQTGQVYRSTNAGNSWQDIGFVNGQPPIIWTNWINLVKAHDANNWMIGGDPVSGDYKVFLSNDAGLSWTLNEIYWGGTSTPWRHESPEMNRLVGVGQWTNGSGNLVKGVLDYYNVNSTGDFNFYPIGTDLNTFADAIKFMNPSTGLALKPSNKTLWKTSDSGYNWSQVGTLSSTAYLDIAMSPTSRMAYLCGGNKICAVGYDNNTIVESSLLMPAIANARAHISVNDKLYICGSTVENKILYSNTPNGSAQAPTISAIRDTLINANTTLFTTFSISDNDLTLDNMQLRITSSNQAMLPDANIVLSSGNGGNWSLYATPKANIYGFTTIKIIYSDKENLSDTCSFNLAVNRIEWTTVPSGTGEQINSVCFPTSQIGYACATNGVIQKSINGGQSWSSLSSSVTSNLNSISFTDANTGFACGDGGIILKTIDAGTNWVSLPTGVTTALTSIAFTDANTGYAVGQSGTIIKTINGGSSWTALASGVTIYLRSVCFIDATSGFAVGQNGTILKTSNSGTNWTALTTGTTAYLRSVSFVNTSIGYATGSSGVIIKTIDAGLNWVVQTSNMTGILYAVNFVNPLCGMAAGQSAVLKTVDGGLNWIPQTGINNNTIYALGVSSSNSIYAVGASGLIINCISPYSVSKPTLAIFQNPIADGYLHFALNIDKYAGLLPTMKVDSDNLQLDTLASGSFMAHYPLYLTGNHTALVYTGDTTITRTFTAAKTGKFGGSFSCDNGDFSVSYPENTEEYTLAAYSEDKQYFVGHSDFKTSKSLTVRWKTKENKAIYCNGQELATYRDGDYLVAKNGKFGKFSLGEAILNSMTTELYGNYPNPFNPTTNIRFALGMEDAGSLTQLKVYNIKGELVETLLNNQLTAGKHIISWNAARYASGVYYYTLKAGTKVQTAKMLMVK